MRMRYHITGHGWRDTLRMYGVAQDRGHEGDGNRRIGVFDALEFFAYGGIIVSALTGVVGLEERVRIGLSFVGAIAALVYRLLRVRFT